VRQKQRSALNAGFDFFLHKIDGEISQEDLIEKLQECNTDDRIHGVLVQLPLPPHLVSEQNLILESISPTKDVDGFHPYNMGLLTFKHSSSLSPWERRYEHNNSTSITENLHNYDNFPIVNVPCAALACVEVLDRYGVTISGKHVVVLGRSAIVGLPVSLLMMHRGATLTNCDELTTNPKEHCRRADIVISAVGSPHLVKKDWIKPGAVVLDIGFNIEADGSVLGDVDFEEVRKVAAHTTPVPGGIGPVTVSVLLHHTLLNAVRSFGNEAYLAEQEREEENNDTSNNNNNNNNNDNNNPKVVEVEIKAPE
jgi:methylenetetrahydrofolate dehydrogenase (NADP+)/methenyltetrahydrofolate cyclohydrolase